MSAENLPYFKFITEIIRSRIWAKLSPAARTLYPVLLSFSDRNFRSVYPGAKKLLELTGFKHKVTLRKARKELKEIGLLTFSLGNGRTNTYYQFRFDFVRQSTIPHRDTQLPPYRINNIPPKDDHTLPVGEEKTPPEGTKEGVPYNQIHISIDNYPSLKKQCNATKEKNREDTTNNENVRWQFLERRFGAEAVRLARSECRLGGLADDVGNVEKLLYHADGRPRTSWDEIKRSLAKHISATSLDSICSAFIGEQENLFIFKDELPIHLKTLLQQACPRVFFEPTTEVTETVTEKSRLLSQE